MLLIMFNLNICFAYVESGRQEYTNLKLEYPLVYLNNKTAQDKINTNIASYVYNLKNKYDHGDIYSGKMEYIIAFEDDTYLSVVLKITEIQNPSIRPYLEKIGIVYNKNTGDIIPLNYFVPVNTPAELENFILTGVANIYVPRPNQYVTKQLGSYHIYRIPQSYIIFKNGMVGIIFRTGEIAPNSDTNPVVVFTKEAIDYINRLKNNY